jgi:hypothetical protein
VALAAAAAAASGHSPPFWLAFDDVLARQRLRQLTLRLYPRFFAIHQILRASYALTNATVVQSVSAACFRAVSGGFTRTTQQWIPNDNGGQHDNVSSG